MKQKSIEKRTKDNYAKLPAEVSPTKLAKDAKKIHAALPKNDFSKRTTILCVALRNNEGGIKKFVFCNKSLMPIDVLACA